LASNKAAGTGKNRPYQFSTRSSYTSVDSLIDKSYYGRHLPEASQDYVDSLPPIDKVVEVLFTRPKGKQIMCPKSTMLFPVFAQNLIDSFIVTEVRKKADGKDVALEDGGYGVDFDWVRTGTPHDINLLPLYGQTQDKTDALRLKSELTGQKGRLKSQVIDGEEYAPFLYDGNGNVKGEFQVLGEPQGFQVILNYLASKFPDNGLIIKKYKSAIFAFGGPRTNTTPQVSAMNTLFLREHNRIAGEIEKRNPDWDDERVFQTARNINLVIYLKIIIEEYINHISSKGVHLKVLPGKWAWNAPWNKPNWISAEFSTLYRWHSFIPDTFAWNGQIVEFKKEIFKNEWLLNSNGLRKAFVSMSANRASAFGPFNTHSLLLEREKSALKISRAAKLQPYGEYCKFLGKKAPKTFQDISRNKDVQQKLKELYGSPDRVEFWVGLVTEDHMPKEILPPTLDAFVAKDAFNQALTHPLISENVFNKETFTEWGFNLISGKYGGNDLKDLVQRNTNGGAPLTEFVGMTNPNWTPWSLA
jgi:prostaglandin-endoperoxide synthase 2